MLIEPRFGKVAKISICKVVFSCQPNLDRHCLTELSSVWLEFLVRHLLRFQLPNNARIANAVQFHPQAVMSLSWMPGLEFYRKMFDVFVIVLAYVHIFVFVLWWSIVIILFCSESSHCEWCQAWSSYRAGLWAAGKCNFCIMSWEYKHLILFWAVEDSWHFSSAKLDDCAPKFQEEKI